MSWKKDLSWMNIEFGDTEWKEKEIEFIDAIIPYWVNHLWMIEYIFLNNEGDIEFWMKYGVWDW